MFKGIKNGLNHINPKHLGHRRGSGTASEAGNSESGGGDDTSQGQPSPSFAAVGPKSVPPPGMAPGKLPPGVIVKGAPPPGAKIMRGPPPGGAMQIISGGAGSVTPPRPGAVSPPMNGKSPPPGVKMLAHPPPGAKIIPGAPPPGVKIVHGAPPPGAKIMHGPPPPGARMISGSPPAALSRPVSPGGPIPPRSNVSPPRGAIAKSPMKVLPPGVKLMKGPPPPGSRPISPEGSRFMSEQPSLIPSRSVSPTNPPVFRILPNGVKVLMGPPPGMPGKIIAKSPPGGRSTPSPPVKSPPRKMLIKSLVQNGSPLPPGAQPIGSRAPSPNNSQLIPHNGSFSVGPPVSWAAREGLPRPTPVRPAGTIVKAVPPSSPPPPPGPAHAAPPSDNGTGSSLHVPQPPSANNRSMGDSRNEEVNFEVESNMTDETGTGGGADDIHFEVGGSVNSAQSPMATPQETSLPPPPAPTALTPQSSASSSESSSSFSFKADADETTALPPAARHKGGAAASSTANSVQSSHKTKPTPAAAVAPKEAEASKSKKRSHRRRSSGSAAGDEPRKHHHRHHHRSRSSGTSSQQSYQVPGAPESVSSAPIEEVRRLSLSQLPPQQQKQSGAANGELVQVPSENQYGSQLSEAAFTPQALTSTSRNRIAEDFLSMLCPQQYYGKVKKINRIRPFKANRAAATGLRSSNSIYVATKGTMPNPYFYPQLRLRDTDGEQPTGLSGDSAADGAVDTPIILYEAAPGNMLFAETELDARRLLESSPNANSCFMLSNSAILFKDPEHYVLPVAALNVQWVPYASPQSEPQCPIHKRELQLFDPYSKELVCALCASRNGVPVSNFVVIPDVLGNAESRQRIQEKVSTQLDEVQQSERRWVEQHQRVRELCESKKLAIHNQFGLLIEALQAKQNEYVEACEAEFAYAQTDVAREILITDEKVQLLRAAFDHLRTEPSQPLFSMQIATIAEGLSASTDMPSRFTRNSLQLPPMSAGLVPNLEGIMAQVLELSPSNILTGVNGSIGSAGAGSRHASNLRGASTANSQTASYRNGAAHRPVDDTVLLSGGAAAESRRRSGPAATPTTHGPSVSLEHRPNSSRSTSAASHPPPAVRRVGGASPTSSPSMARAGDSTTLRDDTSYLSSASQKRSAGGAGAPSPYATDAVSVPNSTGTSLFDFALHNLLSTFDSSNVKRRAPRYIQWAIRVEDPGDWVGLGVGVGNTIDTWEQGSTNDLSHLWIVPALMSGHTLYLRVTVLPSSGHAKLTVHDGKGKQLDGGEIPQWNAARPSYPQATFGGRVGTVRMIEVPHAVR